jgi:four helix bundle protein
MIQNFKAYELAVTIYKELKAVPAPGYLKDQLNRASSSIALNLAEGAAKPTKPDRTKFYAIAFGSLRETQSIIQLLDLENEQLQDRLDHLAAMLYKLVYRSP